MKEFLNILNDDEEIIGQEAREEIHRLGLLHREIHVYFITPNREVIFQHRSKDKDTYPDILDATVGGHVEIGDSYEQTAVKEVQEETGLDIDVSDLVFIGKTRRLSKDPATGKINNAVRQSYYYIFKGDVKDLKIEEGKSLGFEVWPIDKLFELTDEEKKKIIPSILDFSKTELMKYI